MTDERACEQCGKTFHRKRKAKDARRFCTKKCAGVWRSARTIERHAVKDSVHAVRQCRVCQQGFFPSRQGRRFICSKACGQEAARREYYTKWRRVSDRACAECGLVFTPKVGTGNHRLCSSDCREKRQQAQKRIHRAARRAKQRQAQVEPVDPLTVLTRDGWTCQLCGCRTPKRLRGSYLSAAPELDHIVPLSRGGSHSYENTQCACRACNSAKSNAVRGQFRLPIALSISTGIRRQTGVACRAALRETGKVKKCPQLATFGT